MMPTIFIKVPGEPISQPRQRHRVISTKGGKPFVHNYTPSKAPVNDFKAAVALTANIARKGQFFTGPVKVEIFALFTRPKSKTRKTKPNDPYEHTKKPDCDNIAKAVKDALTGVLWRDDSQVYDLRVRKWVGDGSQPPRTEITVEADE